MYVVTKNYIRGACGVNRVHGMSCKGEGMNFRMVEVVKHHVVWLSGENGRW